MSDSSCPPSSLSPRYTPPPELFAEAEAMLRDAYPEELTRAAAAYVAHQRPTWGRSADTGVVLPPFEECSVLVRAGWLYVVRGFAWWSGPLPVQPITDIDDNDDGTVDPFLMGISEIATATRELAEAAQITQSNSPVNALLEDVVAALHTRVKALATPAA